MQHKKKIIGLVITILTALTAYLGGFMETVEAAGHREDIIVNEGVYALQVNVPGLIFGEACLTARKVASVESDEREDLFFKFDFSSMKWVSDEPGADLVHYIGVYGGDYHLDVIDPAVIPAGHYKVDGSIKDEFGELLFLESWFFHIE